MADRMRQIEAEMARFENEISNVSMPPRPTAPGPNVSVRFIPHQVSNRPYAPPPHFQAPPMMPPMGYVAPPRPRVVTAGPAVIESGPTKYAPPGASAASTSGVAMPTKNEKADEPPPGPPRMMTHVLPADVELMQIKRQAETAYQNSYIGQVLSGKRKAKRFVRAAGGQKWEDPSLAEWDPHDYRLFCGDLGNEVSDELLAKPFRRYTSFQKAKVVRDKRTNKSKGYGFVSFKDPQDYIRAMREMNGKYVGNRPIKLKKSDWKERNLDTVKKKAKTKQKLGIK